MWSYSVDNFEDAKLLQARVALLRRRSIDATVLQRCEGSGAGACLAYLSLCAPCHLQTPLRDGWGITADDSGALIVGDSSHRLHFVDPSSMKLLRTLDVTGAHMCVAFAAGQGRGASARRPEAAAGARRVR